MRGTPLAVAVSLLTCSLTWPSSFQASALRLVDDVGDHLPPWAGSQPRALASLGARATFLAQSADDSGLRLFSTDGSEAGTQELVLAGLEDGAAYGVLVGTLDALAVYELWTPAEFQLWATDGTAAGTRLLRTDDDRNVVPLYASVAGISARSGSVLFYFTSDLQGGERELWRTEGTAESTSRVAPLPDAAGLLSIPPVVTDSGIVLFPLLDELTYSGSVWRSDGTPSGTFELLATEDGHGFGDFLALGPRVLFVETGGGALLWASDGTAQGTVALADVSGIRRFSARALTSDGRTAVFTRNGDAGGMEVWLTRGDLSSTGRVAVIDDYSVDHYAYGNAPPGISANGFALLPIVDAERRLDLWSVELASGATARIGRIGTQNQYLADLATDGARATFAVIESPGRSTVWSSDGTAGGTSRVYQALVASEFTDLRLATPVGGRLLFTSRKWYEPSLELWSTDGTPTGTRLLTATLSDAWYGFGMSDPAERGVVGLGGVALFPAADPLYGWELWRADANSATRVADLRIDRPGVDGLYPLGESQDELYFAVADPFTRLWEIRATPLSGIGSRLVLERPFECGRHSCNTPQSVHAVGDRRVLFQAPSEYGPGVALGFDPRTGETDDLFPDDGENAGYPLGDAAQVSRGELLFLAERSGQPGIYATDGTHAGTRRAHSLPAGAYHYSLDRRGDRWLLLETDGGWLRVRSIDLRSRELELLLEVESSYLGAIERTRDGVALVVTRYQGATAVGRDVHWTDGTVAGTRSALSLPFASSFSSAASMEAAPFLLCASTYPSGPAELWTSDGSPERSRLLLAEPESDLRLDGPLVAFRGALFFVLVARRPEGSAIALWRTDGTPEGTREIVSFAIHDGSTYLTELQLVAAPDGLLFLGHDPEHGVEPWWSDGTPEGTALLADLEPGPASSSPLFPVRSRDRVIFTAATSATGRELWSAGGPTPSVQLVADLWPGPGSSYPEIVGEIGDRPLMLADDGVVGREPWTLEEPELDACNPALEALCLGGGRFRVRAAWRKFDGALGEAVAAPLTSETGYFWFFDPANPELLVKVLDACDVPGVRAFWTFTTGLTNVEVTLEIEDSRTGEAQRIETRLGAPFLPRFDSASFQVCDTAGSSPPAAPPQEAAIGPMLPLLGGRFEAEVQWRAGDASGAGEAVALSDQAGYFWFFDPDNVELLVKVLDGCAFPAHPAYWVFAGGLTDLEVELRLRDLFTGQVYRVATAAGRPFPPVLDTGAFATCP